MKSHVSYLPTATEKSTTHNTTIVKPLCFREMTRNTHDDLTEKNHIHTLN